MPNSKNTPKIAIIGIGGAGRNTLTYMIKQGFNDANLIYIDSSQCVGVNNITMPNKLILPPLRADGVIDETAKEQICTALHDYEMVFIIAGMGGELGSALAPTVATVTKELEIPTVALAVMPFNFEGKLRINRANDAVLALSRCADMLICLNNEQLLSEQNLTTTQAFNSLDDDVLQAVKTLMPDAGSAVVSLDMLDVLSIIKSASRAVLSVGRAGGDDRTIKAARFAVESLALQLPSLSTVKGVIISITAADFAMTEVETVMDVVGSVLDLGDVSVFYNIATEDIGDNLCVSVVATG